MKAHKYVKKNIYIASSKTISDVSSVQNLMMIFVYLHVFLSLLNETDDKVLSEKKEIKKHQKVLHVIIYDKVLEEFH